MAINSVKFRTMWNGASAALRKVYRGVPEDNVMGFQAIHTTLVRHNMAHDMRNTLGCLNTLLKAGLISEPEQGCFVRVAVRGTVPEDAMYIEDVPQELTAMKVAFDTAKPTVAEPAAEAPRTEPAAVTTLHLTPVAEQLAPPVDPIDRLTRITASLRTLADDIESTALDFTEQLAMIEAKTEKLEALREMLKGVLV